MRTSSEQPVASQQFPELDALLINRERLIRLLKDALCELHTLHRIAKQRRRGEEILDLIKYWENVLAWIKQFGNQEVVVMSRRAAS
jgi:hypothetical protein